MNPYEKLVHWARLPQDTSPVNVPESLLQANWVLPKHYPSPVILLLPSYGVRAFALAALFAALCFWLSFQPTISPGLVEEWVMMDPLAEWMEPF